MAFRPSTRSNRNEETIEANLTPIMNLMVVLIPLLLTSAQFIKLGIIELNLPPSIGGIDPVLMEKEKSSKKLDLTISITDSGFTLSCSMTILRGPDEDAVSVPLKNNGTYDFELLNRQLMIIKTRIEGEYTDSKRVIVMAEPGIDYQTLVSTMDAARAPFRSQVVSHESKERKWHPNDELFPEVSISAGIVF